MRQSSLAPSGNLLLDALPRGDRQQLLRDCAQVELVVAQALCTPGERIRHVFFPSSGLISLSAPPPGNPGLAIGLIGDEGMIGVWSALGVTIAPFHADVRGKGAAWRMDVATFLRHSQRSALLRRHLHRYVQVTLMQRAQAICCAGYHPVAPRLARWLLMTRDRAHSDDFHITHETLAGILGVRRAGITNAASLLQSRRLIRYSRGDISIIDGRALEAAACGCYAADLNSYDGAMA